MRRRTTILTAAVAVTLLLVGTVPAAAAPRGADLARIRAATAPFHDLGKATAAEWDLVPGLDHCFENPGVGAMGIHYIDAGRLDAVVELEWPEALVYVPGPNGQLRLGAVEYIVPAAAWTEPEPPSLLGQEFHLNETLGVFVLHVWVFEHNPAGMFEDWNPRVTCG